MKLNKEEILKLLQKYRLYIAALAVLLVVIIVLAVSCGSGDAQESISGETSQETEDTAEGEAEEGEAEETEVENVLTLNEHASIITLVKTYMDCIVDGDVDTLALIVDELSDEDSAEIEKNDRAYESYSNLVCYTMNGLEEDAYIAFICYDMKIDGVETLAPGIICLSLLPQDEYGDRLIQYSSVDDDADLQVYVEELEQDEDVQALYADVQARYEEALESDSTLAQFMQSALELASDESEEESAEESEETADASEETADKAVDTGEATAENRTTRVTDTVNVRSEASTDSSRVAVAYQGESVTVVESYENGWSKIEYNGQTGYVMSEYLE
ncbi:MAG: SH3 domain-containing protein [Lachnospiraceae bacterium]|nr:SH3 domain-containing protein [Lachnospiraceae bacterium]